MSSAALEPYRRELTGYCYRMLGSVHEAEDAVQDTMVRAWRALPTFEDRAGFRPWLYRIATNVCLDMLKGRSRRALPVDVAPAHSGELRLGPSRPDQAWVQPIPDRWILPTDADPAELAVSRESVRLAFIAALQHLLPRQRAVLILRDVLRWRAAEVAALLETTTDAVNSTLRRARAALASVDFESAPPEPPEAARALLARYVDAFERFDIDALVALLRDDAIMEMPPYELWLQGTGDIRRWLLSTGACRHHRFVPIAANGSPALAIYQPPGPGGQPEPFAIQVLDVAGGRITAIRTFLEPALFDSFGLAGAEVQDLGQPDELEQLDEADVGAVQP
jgi:RNA polymerase sigma-70 factor (ECF subfamily)